MKIPKTAKISKCRLCLNKKLLKIYSFGNFFVSDFVLKKNINTVFIIKIQICLVH